MEQQRDGMRKTYKYRLIPTPEQARRLELVLSRCRTLYNVALEQRKTWWQRGQGVGATYYQQKAELTELKAAYPDYAEVNAQVLQDVMLRVERTYQAFFLRLNNSETPGYPRFQGWGRYTSFTYPQYGGGALLDGGVLSLSKIGRIRIRVHRPLQGTPKTVTIRQEADGWYACISCADVSSEPLPLTGRETGIDVGLKVFLITADGETVENPRHYRKAERRLKTAQRCVSRRKKGGARRRKAVKLLAKVHLKVKRQRQDFQYKTARVLLRQYDVIHLEDLQVRNLVRNPRLAKSIGDASWRQFRTILTFKAACAGKRVVVVPAQYTSQDCSSCGARIANSLSVRTHVCSSCGLVMDRDENAALNILGPGRPVRERWRWPPR